MNVDIDNFSEVQLHILTKRLIENSELISFDLEFAGLKFQGNDRDRPEYMPAQKYQKMSAVAKKYCIMQVGITFFVPAENSKIITAHPFNFYIFPRPTMYSDPTISMQSGCVSFNIANKMDWSRWIEKDKGITYMKLTEYERISQMLEKARKFEELYNYLEEENQLFVDEIIRQIEVQQNKVSSKSTQILFQLPSSSFTYTRKVIEKYFEEKGKLFIIKPKHQIAKDEEIIEFYVVKISKQEKQKINNKKMEQLYGFTLLFEKIWNSGKTFIGHNLFFDLLFMYDAFIAPLPYDYQLFKKQVTQVKEGPKEKKIQVKRTFCDTKFISNSLNFKYDCFQDSTSLEGIYQTIKVKGLTKKEIILPEEYERYDLKNQVLHEAGFDSYLTGWIYYQMIEIGKMANLNVKEQFNGKINLNRSYFYVDIESPHDGVCQHEKVFYIEAVDPKKFVAIDYIKKQRGDIYKALREILKEENLVKDVLVREGLKQIFIEIREKKSYTKAVQVLIGGVKDKKIKEIHGLHRFLASRNAKEWTECFSKNGAVKDGPAP